MKPNTRAACAGQHALFDSNDRKDHARALEFCVTCPLLLDCHEHTDAVRRDLGSQAVLTGTWAGKLYGAADRGGRKPIIREHGTVKGRSQHYRLHEPVCEPCREAWNAYWRERYSPRQEAS